MGYYIDLEKISIDSYKTKLESGYLPPSRMLLKDNLEERFAYFKSAGVTNVKELIQLLKKKDQVAEFQKIGCLSGNYLAILLRELNSILPKPNKIADFIGISEETVSKLNNIGIKNTVKLYDKVVTKELRQAFAKEQEINKSEMLELTKLTDLSRIKWTGTTFARMLYDLGVDTVEKAAQSDPIELHSMIIQLNKESNVYKANIGLNDIRIFVDAAKEVPLEVEY